MAQAPQVIPERQPQPMMNGLTSFWSNSAGSIQYLTSLLQRVPSADSLLQLSSVDKIQKDTLPHIDPNVASLYLQCAAKHLAFTLQPQPIFDQSKTKQMISTIAEISGKAASACSHRSVISQSGILGALAYQANNSPSSTSENNITGNNNEGGLTVAAVEFLQCALLAGQYRYAARMLHNDWPRPERRMDVAWVLRYYYLRGCIHVGCDDYDTAIRCFLTTLSIPSDVISQIAIDAWKKMVLCKALVATTMTTTTVQPKQPVSVSPPSAASNSVSRFFQNATDALTNPSPQQQQQQDEATGSVSKYVALVRAPDRAQFKELKIKYSALWEADRNTGLVERLGTALEHSFIRHQASIYSVLPLSKLASDLGMEDPQETVCMLSRVDGIQFQLQDEWVVFDLEEDIPMPTPNLRQLMELAERVRQLDVNVASSAKYQHMKGDASNAPPRRGVEDF